MYKIHMIDLEGYVTVLTNLFPSNYFTYNMAITSK